MPKNTESLSEGKIAALRLLEQARADAEDVKTDLWQFAESLTALAKAGTSASDLRWLLVRRYVDHAAEATRPGDRERTFRKPSNLELSERSCFILTSGGAVFMAQRGLKGAATERPPQTAGEAPAAPAERIRWDGARHELWVDGKLAKRFLRDAPAQGAVLDAFQAAQWQAPLEITLPGERSDDAGHRLREVVADLNQGVDPSLVHFRMDGTGKGVIYHLT